MISEEAEGGGALGAGGEIPLQPVEKTMVKQVVLLQPVENSTLKQVDVHSSKL